MSVVRGGKMRLHAAAPSPCASELWPSEDGLSLHDVRFRALLGSAAWSRLPATVRSRFSRRLAAGESIIYAGEIVQCRRTALGRLVGQLCRLIGAPLPLSSDIG